MSFTGSLKWYNLALEKRQDGNMMPERECSAIIVIGKTSYWELDIGKEQKYI